MDILNNSGSESDNDAGLSEIDSASDSEYDMHKRVEIYSQVPIIKMKNKQFFDFEKYYPVLKGLMIYEFIIITW